MKKNIIPCKYEDWNDTTNPRICQCTKYEGVDCANVPYDVSKCPDYKPSGKHLCYSCIFLGDCIHEAIEDRSQSEELGLVFSSKYASANVLYCPTYEQKRELK